MKKLKRESLLFGTVGLAVGALLMSFSSAVAHNNQHHDMMQMMRMHTGGSHDGAMNDNEMSMSEMTAMLKNKMGDDFDKTFLEHTITHHQGAIDMANLAKQNAKHDEVKKLANDILSAQSKEINIMQSWQREWSYKNVPTSH